MNNIIKNTLFGAVFVAGVSGCSSGSGSTPERVPDKPPVVVEKVIKIEEGVIGNVNIFGNTENVTFGVENTSLENCLIESNPDIVVGIVDNDNGTHTMSLPDGTLKDDVNNIGSYLDVTCSNANSDNFNNVVTYSIDGNSNPNRVSALVVRNVIHDKEFFTAATSADYAIVGPNGHRVCMEFNDSDELKVTNNSINIDGCNYTLSVGDNSSLALERDTSGLTELIGKISSEGAGVVFMTEDVDTSILPLFHPQTPLSYKVRNTSQDNPTIDFESGFEKLTTERVNLIASSNGLEDELGFRTFSFTQNQGNYEEVSSDFQNPDGLGDYTLGTSLTKHDSIHLGPSATRKTTFKGNVFADTIEYNK
ncbi:MAG: hypothetical protein HRU03_09370 [Nanoarchaeales archaeon]|nr:hypothetical protein [Nanoarchaeales archaeon]